VRTTRQPGSRSGLDGGRAAPAAGGEASFTGKQEDEQQREQQTRLGGAPGSGMADGVRTLQAFKAYADWACAMHFGGEQQQQGEALEGEEGGQGRSAEEQPQQRAGGRQRRGLPPQQAQPAARRRRGGRAEGAGAADGAEDGGEGDDDEDVPRSSKRPARAGARGARGLQQQQQQQQQEEGPRPPASGGRAPHASAAGLAALPSGFVPPAVPIEAVEAEFWGCVERPQGGCGVEALAADIEANPRPGPPPGAKGARPEHPWAALALSRHAGCALRYLPAGSTAAAAAAPRLRAGSALAADGWRGEELGLYSITYLHVGAPRVCYG
jgi:hypothetical protein